MELIIKPKKAFSLDLRELWRFRELFWSLAMRDLKVRYKQTLIGIVWAVLQPLILMLAFTLFFGQLGENLPTTIPYAIFVYTGLLFWNFFSGSLSAASNSLVANQAIVQKIYFPRLILPLSSIIVNFIDFACALGIFLVLLGYYGIMPSALGLLMIIPALLIATCAAAGLGLWLAAINVKYRDVRYVLPFFIQLLLFITPAIYQTGVIAHRWIWQFNPMTGVIETARNLLFGLGPVDGVLLATSIGVSVALLLSGVIYFQKTEKYFADIV